MAHPGVFAPLRSSTRSARLRVDPPTDAEGTGTDGAKTTLPLGPFLVVTGILMGMLLSA